MKRMLYLPWIGLPNILVGEFLVDELVQAQATAQNLAAAMLGLLRDAPRQARQRARFAEIHAQLRQDTASKAAEAVMGVLKSAHG
jgi:lipid-A-disaccharide synthase